MAFLGLPNEIITDVVDYLDREGHRVALVLLGGVNYLTGELLDIPTITRAGHRAGALVGYLDPAGKPILEAMLRIYGGLLDEIERRRYDVFTRRIELSCGRKLFIAGQVLVRHKLRRIFSRL